MKTRFAKMVVLGIKQFRDPYYQGFAAQMSFFIMLSLVPTIIVLSQLLGVLDIPLDFMDDWVNKYVSPDMAGTLKDILQDSGKSSAATSNIVMIIMALWAASRAQFSMMRIANYTYTSGRTTGSFWRERIRSLKTMALTLFTLAFVAIIPVYGKLILQTIFGQIVEGTLIDTLWTYLRWPIAGALYFLMVSYNYYVLPNEKLKFREIVPGSIFGAVGMLVVTMVYSIYAAQVANYNIIYGSLASFVALLFWFYFLSWVLCLGILFNKVWKDTREGGTPNV
ncbi:YihY/virulence factor BrkB family protein [Emergencia sp.]|uniref:YihY/virulence factor BrkB family protein n=1 Tax=Emergencia sp. TaxID=1926557 RepID=UPI003AEF6227